MQTTIHKQGTSAVITIPATLLDDAGLSIGDRLEILISDGLIILSKAVPHYSLDDLLKRSPAETVDRDDTDREWLTDYTVGKERD